MGTKRTTRIARSLGVTILVVLAAFLVRYALDPLLGSHAVFVLFYGAILFSAWYAGWRYGVFATGLALYLTVQFFIEPSHEFGLDNLRYIVSLTLHVFTVSLGIILIEQLRQAQQNAREEALVRKRAEEALRRSEASLLEAQKVLRTHAEELEKRVGERTEELTRSLRFMEEFLYSMAHDLRAPVRAVKGFTEALLQDYAANLDETAQDYGRRINLACERMDRLIVELLEYGRLSHTTLDLRPVELQPLVASVLTEFQDDIAERNAKVEVASMPQAVFANDVALAQILRNLISNSLKFMPPERKPEIKLWSEDREEGVLICVLDNGIGIPQEHVAKLFKPFHQLHTQDRFEGVGMGLAIARLAAERMDAKLNVSSTPGSSSCFCLELKSTRMTEYLPKELPPQANPELSEVLLH